MSKTVVSSKRGRGIADFEAAHGQPKIRALERRLAEERAKVEALADVQGKVTVETRKDCRIKVAIISDTHFGSLYFHEAALRGFYDHAGQAGVERVFVAGDILDGHRVYRGQEFELRDIGLDKQVDRAHEVSGKLTLPTSFITGNHDLSFKTAAGAAVGKTVEAATGWTFLGDETGRVEWHTPNGVFSMMLVHPGGGAKAYALSYNLQQQINAIEGGNKPDVYVAGHYHKAVFMPSYRNVAGFLGGTFQRQTPFMERQSLPAHVGGWIVEAHVGDGHNVIKAEFVAFYV